jgi:hypothetical protein
MAVPAGSAALGYLFDRRDGGEFGGSGSRGRERGGLDRDGHQDYQGGERQVVARILISIRDNCPNATLQQLIQPERA